MPGLASPATAHSSGVHWLPAPSGCAAGSAPAASSSRATSVSPPARDGSSRCHREAQVRCSAVHPVRLSAAVASPGSRASISPARAASPRTTEVRKSYRASHGSRASMRAARPVQSRTLAARKSSASCPRPAVRGSHLGHQSRPAWVTVLAGDRELRRRQRRRSRHRDARAGGDPGQRGRVPGPDGIAQLLGLAAELVQVRLRRKRVGRQCHLLASASWSAAGAPRRRHSPNRNLPAEADSVLPADPGAPSTRTDIITPSALPAPR